MEVVQRTGGDSPFGRRDVEEWSRLDELTGMLEHARVQTDQWAGIDAQGGSHKYGKKVVDASKTGDAGKHLQRQQLEVFQSKVAGGAMHMVKTQTSSAWSHHGNRNTTGASTTVSSRTRWSSRSQQQQQTTGGSLEQPAITENFANLELQINPIDVSTLKNKANVGRSGAIGSRRPPSARSRRLSASKSGVVAKIEANTELIQEPPEEMTCEVSNKTRAFDFEELKSNLKLGEILGRRLSKSSSTDDLPVGDNSRESDSDSGSWRRGTRVRRSLQFSTKEDASSVTPTIASKRHSFVTVESLRDVRSRLKHCDPLFTDDNDMTQNILLKNDDRINNSSGLVRAIEQGTKMASTTTTFGSVSGKTDNLESHDWKRAESETNKTVVTLNEQSEGGMVSPTKKRFNESFAFFRGGYENHKNGSLKNFPARQNLITIPIIFQQELSNEIDKTRFSLRSGRDSETSGEESESLGWASRRQLDGLAPLKRRSWAGDSTLFNNRDEEKTMSLTFSSEQEESVQSFGSNQMKKNKRVEFCKTEVHFAAESGKFNIVETDEKPPPSNNFRRRRRSHPVTENGNDTSPNNSLQVAQKPPLPELRFGDTTYEKQMLTATTKHDVSSATQELTKEKSSTNIALTEKSPEIQLSNGIYKRHSADLTSQDVRARGKSMSEATTLVRSTVTLKIQPPEPSKPSPSINLDPEAGTMELQKLIKSLRPTSASRRSLDSSLLITEEEPLDFSVAERIKLHEDRKVKGFSTKVNMGGTTVVRNSESIWLPGSHEQSNHQEVKSDEKHDVEESSFNKSPPQLSPSKIVAPIAPVANPRTHSTSNGPSITSISLSYESSQPKILASINSCSKPLVKKETRDTTNIVAPIPLKCVKPIKYPGDSKIDTKTPTCPRLEKVSTFKSSKSESKFSSIGKKEGSPVRLLDITSPTTRAQSPAKRQTRTQSPAHGSKHKKPEFYFGAEVLEVEPRPADDRRRLDNTDDEDVEEAAPARKRGVSPSKRLSAPAAKDDLAKKRSASKERTSTSALIEELTRAADEILQAVNGYDDSVVSSDDEKPRPMMPLPVLKEGVITNEKIVKSTAASRLRKQNIGRTSSTSSVDSVNHENSTPRSTTRTRKTITNGTRACAKVSETTSSSATTRRTRITRKRSDSLTSSKGDEEEAEKANERLKMTKNRKATTTSSGQDTVSSTRSSKVVAKPEASVRTRAPVERIIPPANKKGATKSRKDDMFQSNRVINGATAERRLQLLESSCSGSGLRSDSSPGAKRHQHRTVRNAPLKVSAK